MLPSDGPFSPDLVQIEQGIFCRFIPQEGFGSLLLPFRLFGPSNDFHERSLIRLENLLMVIWRESDLASEPLLAQREGFQNLFLLG